jgi:hypothetical protein
VAAMLILQNKERLMVCNDFTTMVSEIQTIIKNPRSLNCHKLMKVSDVSVLTTGLNCHKLMKVSDTSVLMMGPCDLRLALPCFFYGSSFFYGSKT